MIQILMGNRKAESVKGEQRSLDERAWYVNVPANGTVTLSAQIDTRY